MSPSIGHFTSNVRRASRIAKRTISPGDLSALRQLRRSQCLNTAVGVGALREPRFSYGGDWILTQRRRDAEEDAENFGVASLTIRRDAPH